MFFLPFQKLFPSLASNANMWRCWWVGKSHVKAFHVRLALLSNFVFHHGVSCRFSSEILNFWIFSYLCDFRVFFLLLSIKIEAWMRRKSFTILVRAYSFARLSITILKQRLMAFLCLLYWKSKTNFKTTAEWAMNPVWCLQCQSSTAMNLRHLEWQVNINWFDIKLKRNFYHFIRL